MSHFCYWEHPLKSWPVILHHSPSSSDSSCSCDFVFSVPGVLFPTPSNWIRVALSIHDNAQSAIDFVLSKAVLDFKIAILSSFLMTRIASFVSASRAIKATILSCISGCPSKLVSLKSCSMPCC